MQKDPGAHLAASIYWQLLLSYAIFCYLMQRMSLLTNGVGYKEDLL